MQESIEEQSRQIDELISELQENIEEQSRQIDELIDTVDLLQGSSILWSDDKLNYLAIGNSITSHGLADYWWNESIGMAASSEEKDYVHQVCKWLETTYNEQVDVHTYNFYTWEVQATDRAETLQLLDKYLSSKIDLVTIQLSENVSDISTFEEDCEELYRYILSKAPNAQVLVIDDFWDNGNKSLLKEKAASACNLNFVSLDEIKGKVEYQAGLGTIVYDKNGNEHAIEHQGVAVHPGDKGMMWIAEAVEKEIALNLK